MSDGKYLSGEGWRDEKVSLVPNLPMLLKMEWNFMLVPMLSMSLIPVCALSIGIAGFSNHAPWDGQNHAILDN